MVGTCTALLHGLWGVITLDHADWGLDWYITDNVWDRFGRIGGEPLFLSATSLCGRPGLALMLRSPSFLT